MAKNKDPLLNGLKEVKMRCVIYGRVSTDKQEADNPLKLLQKVLDTLNDIDTTQQSFQEDPQILECVREIGRKVWEYKKMLEK